MVLLRVTSRESKYVRKVWTADGARSLLSSEEFPRGGFSGAVDRIGWRVDLPVDAGIDVEPAVDQ